MGCVSLNALQAHRLGQFVQEVEPTATIWIHSHYDYVYVEVEESNGKTAQAKKIWENGMVTNVKL